MGQTGFCENLRFPAVSCENLPLRSAVIDRKSGKSAEAGQICEKLRIRLGLSHVVSTF